MQQNKIKTIKLIFEFLMNIWNVERERSGYRMQLPGLKFHQISLPCIKSIAFFFSNKCQCQLTIIPRL